MLDQSADSETAGISLETKLGMVTITILVFTFGFLVYRKVDLHHQRLMQVNIGAQNREATDSNRDGAAGSATEQPPELSESGSPAGGELTDVSKSDSGATETIAFLDSGDANDTSPVLPSGDQFASVESGNDGSQPSDADPFPKSDDTSVRLDLPSGDASDSGNVTDFSSNDVPSAGSGDSDRFEDSPELSMLPAETVDEAPSVGSISESDSLEKSGTEEFSGSLTETQPSLPEPDTQQEEPQIASLDAGSFSEPAEASDSETLTLDPVQIPADDQSIPSADSYAQAEPEQPEPVRDPVTLSRADETSKAPHIFAVPDADRDPSASSRSSAPGEGSPADLSVGTEPEPVLIAMAEPRRGEDPFSSLSPSEEGSLAPAGRKSGGQLRNPNEEADQTFSKEPDNQQGFDLNGYNYQAPASENTAENAEADATYDVVTVEEGDNYSKISRRVYGTNRFFSALAVFNQHRISNPKRMRPGMKVLVPPKELLDEKYPELTGRDTEGGIQRASFMVLEDGSPAYRVGDRETLSEIAERFLGRSTRWTEIYRLNQRSLKNPNRLKPGTILVLPPDAVQVNVAQ